MTEIDYEALAYVSGLNALAESYFGVGTGTPTKIARAVVAAYDQQLRDQGLVVVPEVAWGIFMDRYANAHQNELTYSHLVVITEEEGRRIDAALAAPDDGETP
jgi:hypothetical protein